MKKLLVPLFFFWIGWTLFSFSLSKYFFGIELHWEGTAVPPNEVNEPLFTGLLLIGLASNFIYFGFLRFSRDSKL